MGWGGGADIFDAVVEKLLEKEEVDKKEVIKTLLEALEDADWDCQTDTTYYSNPLIREIFKEVHPDWFGLSE